VTRLHLRIFLALLGSLLLFGFLLGALWRHVIDPPPPIDAITVEQIVALLAPPEAPPALQAAAVQRLRATFGVSAALFAEDGRLLAHGGPFAPPFAPRGHRPDRGWRRHFLGPPREIDLGDGRRLVLRSVVPFSTSRPGPLAGLVAAGLAAALASYAVARGLSRRIERLQAGVERWALGDLKARVEVRGRDEVAALANTFNRAAERIDALVQAQRGLLANASHELRSPLARLRLALEMHEETANPIERARMAREIRANLGELDALIEEVLTASRLEAAAESAFQPATVDLLALARDLTQGSTAVVEGETIVVHGDARLLRRAVRNLLDNAHRHGAPPIEVRLARGDDVLRLTVADRGPGVPANLRERVFEPFFRLPGHSEGSGSAGLGLALVRQIARRHGGEARCEERAGGGALFSIELPIHQEVPCPP
jgi:signal transduction histidine kinase